MPLFDLENPDTGDIITVEHPQAPTQEEAQQLLSSLQAPTSQSTVPTQASVVPEEFRTQLQQQLNPSVIDKGLELAKTPFGIVKSLGDTLGEALQGATALSEEALTDVRNNPSRAFGPAQLQYAKRLAQTGLETGGQIGADVLQLLTDPQVSSKLSEIANPLQTLLTTALQGKVTPSESRVEQEFQQQTQREEFAKEREGGIVPEVLGVPAEVGLAKGLAQIVDPQMAGAVLTGRALTTMALKSATPDLGRLVRTALKPSNPKIAARIENATKESIGDIFHADPLADTKGAMPIEGFASSVKNVRQSIGDEISEIQKLQNNPINSGDDIADALEKEATKFEKSGGAASEAAYLRERANDFRGNVVDIDSTQTATTRANRQNTPLFQQTRAQSNPKLADAETTANRIIAETGGKKINQALEKLGGERGAKLRKTWSNLRTIEDQAENRLNQIINSAPKDTRPALIQALTSFEGLAGLAALSHGLTAGAVGVLGSIAKTLPKASQRILKDSNANITKLYDNLRKSSPAASLPARRPLPPPLPTVPIDLEAQLLDALQNVNQRPFEPSGSQIQQTLDMESLADQLRAIQQQPFP